MMIERILQGQEVSSPKQGVQPRTKDLKGSSNFADLIGSKLKEAKETKEPRENNNSFSQKVQDSSVKEQDKTALKETSKEEAAVKEIKESEKPSVEEESKEEAVTPEASVLLLAEEIMKLLQQLEEINPELKALVEQIQGEMAQTDLKDGAASLNGLLQELNQLLQTAELSKDQVHTAELLNQLQQNLAGMGDNEAQALAKEVKKLIANGEEANSKVLDQGVIPVQSQDLANGQKVATVEEGAGSTFSDQSAAEEAPLMEEPTAVASPETDANPEESAVKGVKEEALELKATDNSNPGNAQVVVEGAKADVQFNGIESNNQQVDVREIMEQIVNRAEISLKEGKSEVKLQLMPENLGSVYIKISMEKGAMTAKVYAENIQVKELIDNNLNQLRINLGEKGINVSSLEVSVGQDPRSFERQQTYYQHQSKLKRLTNDRINQSVMGVMYQEADQRLNPYGIESNFDGLA